MKILVTGSNGLLGQKIIYALKTDKDAEVIATSKGVDRIADKSGYRYEALDLSDEKQVKEIIGKHKPDCIINTAAMTNVDACEKDKLQCKALNVDAVQFLVNECKKYGTHLIHLSTDFVFDGQDGPYKEDDIPNPLSYYAQCKLESELLVSKSSVPNTVIRTIIIYGVTDDVQRSNIVLWVRESLMQKKNINVISDQYRSPTLAEDLADACITAANERIEGMFHVSGSEIMSILETAYKVAGFFQLDPSFIHPVTTKELNQPALRPLRTGFIIDKAKKQLNYHPHSFEEGLEIVAGQLRQKGK